MNVITKSELPFAKVFAFSKTLPAEERYSLTDQSRRASRSIGAQIAEAWGKRDYERHFVSKLSDSGSENMETQHWIITAVDDGYLPRPTAKELFNLSLEIGRMLNRMTERAKDFCPDPNATILREAPNLSEWFNPLRGYPFAEDDAKESCNLEPSTEH
jgi:four helix bundle protein